ncbi:hypothetical protein, partial [Helicobacter pylori]|uniref:hypothetical protein n=1 Tax=Helicobacter pylori TaxID=210 RepID=UPI001E30B3D6
WLEAEVIKIKHPFLKLFYPKKKKTELEKVLFLVFMLFLMKINLKSYLVFKRCYFKCCNFKR